MENKHHVLLREALSHSRLTGLHDLYFAWADKGGLDTAKKILGLFDNDVDDQTHELCFDSALKPLSTLPISEIPPLISYLDPPDSPQFPSQAIGLHILLDQAPRSVLKGVDQRWTFGFFSDLAMRFARELAALDPSLQPQRLARWQALGYSFEASWLRAFLTSTAFIHSEDLDAQRYGQNVIEEQCRKVAEAHYGVADPTREIEQQDAEDLALFPKLVINVGKDTDTMSREDALWLSCRIIRAHGPIIERYGRYPYRNGAVGRADTQADLEFYALTNNFGRADPEVSRLIREDTEAGRIRPLQSEQLKSS